jgi:polyisoprenoid-binding protein YceI
MRKTILKTIFASTVTLSSLATSSFAFAAPETFTSDASHTYVYFEYNHLGFSTQRSRFDKVNANIKFDAEAKTGSVEVSIDPKSVNTGWEKFNQHLQSDEFFDVAQFGFATFKSTKVVFSGDVLSQIEGNLTIKGITRPVTLKVSNFKVMPHPFTKKDTIGANAVTTIKRSDFGLGKNVPYVGDETTLNINLEASKN